MQQIKANITLEIPEDKVLLDKIEFYELQQKAEAEWVSGLGWLSEQTGIKSPQQLKEKLLYPYKDELIDFVDYPQSKGETWRFNVYPMKVWLRTNFAKVVK